MNLDEQVPYVADDNVISKALVFGAGGAIDAASNFGQIERTGDTDTFTFTTAGVTTLNLRIDPLEYLRMLDVEATICNAANAAAARGDLAVHRPAQFANLSLPAGSYRLVVRGGAEGTPANGFSNYSSLGYYGMKGTLTGAIDAGYPVLTSGVAMGGVGAASGTWKYFTIEPTCSPNSAPCPRSAATTASRTERPAWRAAAWARRSPVAGRRSPVAGAVFPWRVFVCDVFEPEHEGVSRVLKCI